MASATSPSASAQLFEVSHTIQAAISSLRQDYRLPAEAGNLNEEVIEPKENTPEWAIYQILDAARSEKDDEETFQKFYAQFDPETEAESWVRQQYWPRARKHVSKYLQGDPSQGVVYKICDRRPEGEGKVKIFIQSTDPSKSNPPIALKKDDAGKWKVVFYTP